MYVPSASPASSTSCARALLVRFGSVAGVGGTGPAEWLEVPGIGPERARALEETFQIGATSLPPGDHGSNSPTTA
jgi:DNA repair protein RadC